MSAKSKTEKQAEKPVEKSGAVGASGSEKEQKTDVLTGKEAAQADAVAMLGKAIITATGVVAGKYLDLCLYIRKHSVAPKLVSFELQRLGFKRSRISEVNRVAQASENLFRQYEAKMIGFDKVLNMSRVEKPGTLPIASPAALLLEQNHAVNSDEVDAMVKKENTPGTAEGKKVRKASDALTSAAKVLCCKSTREKVYRFKDAAWECHVRKLPKTGPAVGDDVG
jgi:hypothetical protein